MDEHQIKGNRKKVRAFLGLGSNVGDRVGYVQQAMQFLKDQPRLKVLECSSLYETEPVGDEYKHWFVNAVAAIETDLQPHELLALCLGIEERFDQLYDGRSYPDIDGRRRIIDLDILFYGNTCLQTADLAIPHPNIPTRAYALVPLLEIAPTLIHPKLKKSVAQMHEDLPEPEVVFLYGTRGDDDA